MSDEKISTTSDSTNSTSDSTSASTSASTSDSSATSSSTTKGKSAAALSTSHFSSVRSDKYRAGWEEIFGGGKTKSVRRDRTVHTKAKPNGPVSVELSHEDLHSDLLKELEVALRQKARKEKIKLGRISRSRPLTWRLTGEIGS